MNPTKQTRQTSAPPNLALGPFLDAVGYTAATQMLTCEDLSFLIGGFYIDWTDAPMKFDEWIQGARQIVNLGAYLYAHHGGTRGWGRTEHYGKLQ